MKKWSVILLCVWLIITGAAVIFDLSFKSMDVIIPLLGVVAGVLLLLSGKSLKDFHPVGLLLLSIWLILSGAIAVFDFSFEGSAMILAAVAIAASVFIFIGAKKKKIQDWLGALLLALYLLFTGLIIILDLSFDGLPFVMGCLAIASGILLLIRK